MTKEFASFARPPRCGPQLRDAAVLTMLGFVALALSACQRPKADASFLATRGGTIIDNGGDALNCRSASSSGTSGHPQDFSGSYEIDYVVTADPRLGANDDAEGASWELQRARLEAFLADKMPQLLPNFQAYADRLESGDDSQNRVWKAVSTGLVELEVPALLEKLPSNCLRQTAEGKTVPDITQLVVRREVTTGTSRKIFYYYDYDAVTTMRKTNPLQYAYLVVHEWLWDFTDSPWINRVINHVMQTRSGTAMSGAAFSQYLQSLGISSDTTGKPGPAGPAEDGVQQLFSRNPVCNYDQRFTLEVQRYDPVNRIVLAPGASRDFVITVPPDLLPEANFAACGFALMLTYQATNGSIAPLQISLDRGLASFTYTLTAGTDSRPSQRAFTGQCEDRLCVQRSGELSDVLTPNDFQGSRWQLHLTNAADNATNIELFAPYFVFVGQRGAAIP